MATLLAASGAAQITIDIATITNKRSLQLRAQGVASASGSAALVRKFPEGGLTDFSVWVDGQPDPVMSRAVTSGIEGYGTDVTASRAFLAATAPREYNPSGNNPLWKSAAYAGVGIRWTSMPNGQKHAFQQVQFEKVNFGNRLSWAATSWEMEPTYMAHPLSHFATVTRTDEAAFSGTYSGKITYQGHSIPAGIAVYSIEPISVTGVAPCTPGEVIGGSVTTRMDRQAWWSAGLVFYDENYDQIGSWWRNDPVQHPGGGQWSTSNVYRITAPAGSAWVAVVPKISPNSTWDARDSIAPVGETVYCDMHRIWSHPYKIKGSPSEYTPPRKLTIDIKANRVNQIKNPSGAVNTAGWGALGYGSMPFPVSHDSVTGRLRPGSLKFSAPANLTSYGVSQRMGIGLLTSWNTDTIGGFGWKPNSIYTVSVYVRPDTNTPSIMLNTSYESIAGVITTAEARANHPELIEGEWIRLWSTFMTPANENGLVGLTLTVDTAEAQATGTGALFWTDDALSEEGAFLQEYFDGDTDGSDFLWSGPENFSSSHYYRGFRSNAYRLSDIVKSAVPHGTQVEIRYAQDPS